MELTALIEALRMLPEDAETTIYSDSNLSVMTVNAWGPGWERHGWRRGRNKKHPIANVDLVQELMGLARAHPRVSIQWVEGHAGNRWNEWADALAREAAHQAERAAA